MTPEEFSNCVLGFSSPDRITLKEACQFAQAYSDHVLAAYRATQNEPDYEAAAKIADEYTYLDGQAGELANLIQKRIRKLKSAVLEGAEGKAGLGELHWVTPVKDSKEDCCSDMIMVYVDWACSCGERLCGSCMENHIFKLHQAPTTPAGLGEGRGGWISVDERLPEDYVTVLIAHTVVPAGALVPAGDYVWIGKIVGKHWLAADSRPGPQELHANVTHWRPLPAPPSSEGREGEK